MIRIQRQRALASRFPTAPEAFRPTFSSYYRYVGPSGASLGDEVWADYRTAWAGAAVAATYFLDTGTGTSHATLTAATLFPVSNPATPLQAWPGDVVSSNLVLEPVPGNAGTLVHGVTWHHADGSTTTAALATTTAAAWAGWVPGDPFPIALTPRTVPDDVVGVSVWVQSTGGGWRVSDASIGLSSMSVETGAYTIRRGRSNGDATAPSTISGTAHLPGLPVLVTGTPVQVQLDVGDVPGTTYDDGVRFVGAITDAGARITPGGPQRTPVVGVTALGRLAGVYVGDAPWPAESGLERAARILGLAFAAGVDLDIDIPAGAGGLTVAARDVDRQSALALLDELVVAGVRVTESRTGVVSAAADPPATTAPVATLTPDQYARPLDLPQEPAGQDRVAVEWGPSTDRRVLTLAVNPLFVQPAALEPVSTILGSEDAALIYAHRLLAAQVATVWGVRGLTVDVLRLLERGTAEDLDVVRALLALEPGQLLQLEDLPVEAPRLAGRGLVIVDGWAETIGPGRWRFDLDVVDAPLRMAPRTWTDRTGDPTPWTAWDPTPTWATAPAYR